MAPSRVSAATVAFWTATIIATASLGTLAAMTLYLGSQDSSTGTTTQGLTLAAGALDIVSLLSTIAAAALFLLRVARQLRLICCTGFALLAVAAALATMYSLAWTWNMTADSSRQDEQSSSTQAITQAGFAIWAIGTFSQILLYSIIVWPYKRSDSSLPPDELASRLKQVRRAKLSPSVHMSSLQSSRTSPDQPADATDPTASHFSSPSLSPRSSIRRSVFSAVRPMTSKTRLLWRGSVASRGSPTPYTPRTMSIQNSPTQNEFHDWDTSGAIGTDDQHHDSVVYTRPTRTRLEPIPGSRPVSPAKRLDGPFKNTDPEDPPLPDSPKAPPPVFNPERGSQLTRPRPGSRPRSKSSQHESHIHPLFRSESPNPPPLASPGTVITASPHAGQTVSPDQQFFPPPRVSRSANSSRPASPSPLSPVPSAASRQDSVKSVRRQPSPPVVMRAPSALPSDAGKRG